ncbi:hypothetical protein ACCO45_013179 [Purpureocillium lilacinum]|uniref:Uncharacterized protein n=1 Tax=Purpureocillium lilacinum TaxID=33203 RepID=A0ACC4DA45_PURLI
MAYNLQPLKAFVCASDDGVSANMSETSHPGSIWVYGSPGGPPQPTDCLTVGIETTSKVSKRSASLALCAEGRQIAVQCCTMGPPSKSRPRAPVGGILAIRRIRALENHQTVFSPPLTSTARELGAGIPSLVSSGGRLERKTRQSPSGARAASPSSHISTDRMHRRRLGRNLGAPPYCIVQGLSTYSGAPATPVKGLSRQPLYVNICAQEDMSAQGGLGKQALAMMMPAVVCEQPTAR